MVSRPEEEWDDEEVEFGVIGDRRLKKKNSVFAAKELSEREREDYSAQERPPQQECDQEEFGKGGQKPLVVGSS